MWAFCLVPMEVRRRCPVSWNWSYRGWWLPRGYWDQNLGPLHEQPVKLTKGWALYQPLDRIFCRYSDSYFSFLASPGLGFEVPAATPSFSWGSEGSNSGLHACAASSLLTEQLPKHPSSFLCWHRVLVSCSGWLQSCDLLPESLEWAEIISLLNV